MPRKVEVSVPTTVVRRDMRAVVRRRVAVPDSFNAYPIVHASSVVPGDHVLFGFVDDSSRGSGDEAAGTLALFINDERVWCGVGSRVDPGELECWIEEPRTEI